MPSKKRDVSLELDDAERQLIEMLREQSSSKDNLRIVIELLDGAWEIEMSALLATKTGTRKHHAARGVGRTFSQAWEDMNPTWA